MTTTGTRSSAWLVAVGVVAVLGLGGVGPARSEGWSAGVAAVDITPAGPVWLSGYGARRSPSTGVTRPIHAKALALRDAEGHTAVLVTAELIGFHRPLTDAVAARLKSSHGLARESVVFFASHTHTGPAYKEVARFLREFGLDPAAALASEAFRRDLEEKLVKVVGDALSALAPASVSFGTGRAGFAMNRRQKTPQGYILGVNPSGPTDQSVPVLKVADPGGKLRAVVFGYACHNTTLTEKELTISGDYAGFAQAAVESAHPGATALFVTGCAGDANPEPRGTMDLARRHGRALADAVEAVLSAPMKPLAGPIRGAYAETTLHFAGPTNRASYEARLKEPGAFRQSHARRVIAALDAGKSLVTEYPYPAQAFALGDGLTLVALAGEVVVDYAIRLQKELGGGDNTLWVAAYANDDFGYVPSLRVLKEGGYEAGDAFFFWTFPAPLGPDTEEAVVRLAGEVVRKVRGGR
jgi:neutral ceramidase